MGNDRLPYYDGDLYNCDKLSHVYTHNFELNSAHYPSVDIM